jgi:hypothetical protein
MTAAMETADVRKPLDQHLQSQVDRLADLVSTLRTQLRRALPLGASATAVPLGGALNPCPYIQTRVPLAPESASAFVQLTRAYLAALTKETGFLQ